MLVTRFVVNRARPTGTCSISHPPPHPHPFPHPLTKVTEQVSPSGLFTPNACRSLCCEKSTPYSPLLYQPTSTLTPPPRLRPWTLSLTKVTKQESPSGLVYSQCFITRFVVNRARRTRTCSISPLPLTTTHHPTPPLPK